MNNDKNTLYTDEELAEAHFIPAHLTPAEREEAAAEIRAYRLERLKTMSDSDKLLGNLLYMKFQIEDYLKQVNPSETQNFSTFLEMYLKTLGKKQIDFAAEISLHPTKLNQILKNKITPNLALIYRLEKHSGGLIDALLWWKLVAKKMEADIQNDTQNRDIEARKVHFALAFH